MSSYPFKCDLCGGVTDAPTYGDFTCQHCGQAYVYDECHQIKLSEPQLEALRQMPVIGRLGDQVMKDIVQAFAGVPKWIPVSERLPEHGDAIWVYHGKDVFMGEYWQGTGFHSYGASVDREGLNSETLHGVTHWMEIDEPEPPEVK